MNKSLLAIAALAAFGFAQTVTAATPMLTAVDATANTSTLYQQGVQDTLMNCQQNPAACGINIPPMPPMPSLWLGVPDVPTGLLNLPAIALVVGDPLGADQPVCFSDVKLMMMPGEHLDFRVVGVGGEIPMDKCPLPAKPMMP